MRNVYFNNNMWFRRWEIDIALSILAMLAVICELVIYLTVQVTIGR